MEIKAHTSNWLQRVYYMCWCIMCLFSTLNIPFMVVNRFVQCAMDWVSCLVFGAQQGFQLLQWPVQLLSTSLTSSRVPQLGLELCYLEHNILLIFPYIHLIYIVLFLELKDKTTFGCVNTLRCPLMHPNMLMHRKASSNRCFSNWNHGHFRMTTLHARWQ